jgi:hypothetical protein
MRGSNLWQRSAENGRASSRFEDNLRYNATHHLFPSMLYYNIRVAHKRLVEQLS